MKKIFYLFTMSIIASVVLIGCIDDVPNTSESIFDKWLKSNYIDTYNIDYKYKMDDKEIDFSKHLVPASIENSMKLASIIQHAWLDAYVEVAGFDFMRNHAPPMLQVIGSASWNSDGTITLGTAEGGLKITIYMANWLNPGNVEEMNNYFFNTMHHEFTHILHQDVNYPQDFNSISASDYSPSGWYNRSSINDYATMGFVSAYAGSMGSEDIVEVTCRYLTYTDEQWNRLYAAAGPVGSNKINQKVQIMKDYMSEKWNIDMDKLRDVVNRRMEEISLLQLLRPEWESLINQYPASANFNMDKIESEFIANIDKLSEHFESHPLECQIHNVTLLNNLQPN